MFGRRNSVSGDGAAPAVAPVRPTRESSPPNVVQPDVFRQSPGAGQGPVETDPAWLDTARRQLAPVVDAAIDDEAVARLTRGELAAKADAIVAEVLAQEGAALEASQHETLVATLVDEMLARRRRPNGHEPAPTVVAPEPTPPPPSGGKTAAPARDRIGETKLKVQPLLMERIDIAAASKLPRDELVRELGEIVAEVLAETKIQLNRQEQRELVRRMVDDMLGLGPLEPLLQDESITDIMVNGAGQVYVERQGKLALTGVRFRDNTHVMNVATRIVTLIGRRIDETSPLCDARLMDGSRVNIIIPPLAIDGPSISIRKFAKKGITLELMERQGNLSPQMATVLRIAARCRLNILISGGTGSGKTTLLNAMSQTIDAGDRIVTIEDAAELQLQQPHVVRLETRPANIEGAGEITMRDLVKNSLRMRPDRIILGEVRGSEAVDMLQAMNTGHEGSLGTIHANRPREALTRLENMIGLAGINLPSKAVRTQIASAIDLIVQVSRMRDGIRRITHVMEVVGMEGDVITTQDLFHFVYEGEATDGRLKGTYRSSGLRPNFATKAEYFGLDRALLEAMG